MEINVISEALKFMVLGMGVVFSFLIILIFVLKGQASLLGRFFPAKEKIIKKVQPKVDTSSSKKVAAIVAAVQHHKNIKG